MNFKPFLQLSCQLVDSNVARIEIEGRMIEFHTSDGRWMMTSDIRSEKAVAAMMGSLPSSVQKGIHVAYNHKSESITLSQNVSPLDTLLKFKKALDSFVKLLEEWESAFEPVAK